MLLVSVNTPKEYVCLYRNSGTIFRDSHPGTEKERFDIPISGSKQHSLLQSREYEFYP